MAKTKKTAKPARKVLRAVKKKPGPKPKGTPKRKPQAVRGPSKKRLQDMLKVFVFRGFTLDEVQDVNAAVQAVVYNPANFTKLPATVKDNRAGHDFSIMQQGQYVQISNNKRHDY